MARPSTRGGRKQAVVDHNTARRQRFIDQARDASQIPEAHRPIVVTQLVRDAAALEGPVEAEIFQAAYGDPTGKVYWEFQVSEPISVVTLAHILAAHSAKNLKELDANIVLAVRAFRDAARVGETWLYGDTSSLLRVDDVQDSFEGLSAVLVDVRAAVNWLLSKPRREHLVPASLRQYLASLSLPKTASSDRTMEPKEGAQAPAGEHTPSEGSSAPAVALVTSKARSSTRAQMVGGMERKRGRPPVKRSAVIQAIRADLQSGKIDKKGLHDMPDKEATGIYGDPHRARRTIVREARDFVLSEIENGKADK